MQTSKDNMNRKYVKICQVKRKNMSVFDDLNELRCLIPSLIWFAEEEINGKPIFTREETELRNSIERISPENPEAHFVALLGESRIRVGFREVIHDVLMMAEGEYSSSKLWIVLDNDGDYILIFGEDKSFIDPFLVMRNAKQLKISTEQFKRNYMPQNSFETD
jgi:hypothetical protein